MIIDMNTKKELEEIPSGTWGNLSYTRLTEILRDVGEIKYYEKISHLYFTPNGIEYRVEKIL